MQDYFADTVGNVTVTGNLVRIDFIKMVGVDPETKQVKFELSHRLVMPLDGFLHGLQIQEDIREKLVKDGVLTRQQPEPSKTFS